MVTMLNQAFRINNLFGFWGNRALLSIRRMNTSMDNGTFDIDHINSSAEINGNNSTFNVYANNNRIQYDGSNSIFNLYKQNQEMLLGGQNNVANLYAPYQTISAIASPKFINQYSYGAWIKLEFNAHRTIVNMFGWSSFAQIFTNENKINGSGKDLNVSIDGNSNVASMSGAGSRIALNGSDNVAYLKGSNQFIRIRGNKNTAELDGEWGLGATVEGGMNTINIRRGGSRVVVVGQQNTINLYQQYRAFTIDGRGSQVNLFSKEQTVSLAGLSQVATIYNANRLSVTGISHTKISVGSHGSLIDVSQLRSGVIYQAIGSKNSIIGNSDQRIAVINTSLAFFTSTLASIGPPPIPAGASFSIATSAFSPQSAVTIAT